MGYYSDLVLSIQADAHDMGDDYGQEPSTVYILAKTYGITPQEVADILSDDIDDDSYDEYDDSMDGDAESALASAGFGTDEDYGYFGGEDF